MQIGHHRRKKEANEKEKGESSRFICLFSKSSNSTFLSCILFSLIVSGMMKEIFRKSETSLHRKQRSQASPSRSKQSDTESEASSIDDDDHDVAAKHSYRRSRSISWESSNKDDSDRTDPSKQSPTDTKNSSSRHCRTTRRASYTAGNTELPMVTQTIRSNHRRNTSPRRTMTRRPSTDTTEWKSPRRNSPVETTSHRRTIRSTAAPRRRLSMTRVGDVTTQSPSPISSAAPSSTPTRRRLARHSSAVVQKVTPTVASPRLNRSHSAGAELEHPKTPRAPKGDRSRTPSIRRHRSTDSSDPSRRRRKSFGETTPPKKSPSRRRTVTRSLAGIEITIELQEGLFPTKFFQRKSQLMYKVYSWKSKNNWVEKATHTMVGNAFSAVILHMSLSCDEAKDFLQSDNSKPIEIRMYDGKQLRGSIALPMHTTKASWFTSLDSSFQMHARVTLQGSTMRELEAGSVLENVPAICTWQCKLPISVIALTKKHGVVHWDECLGTFARSSKSGALERAPSSLLCDFNKLPLSVAALFFVVSNDSSERVSCRLEQGVGVGLCRMTVPADQTVVLGRLIRRKTSGWELMGLMQSFPIVSDLGAMIPVIYPCALDVIEDPVSVGRTAWMLPNDCIRLQDYCPQTTSLVVDIRCKEGDIIAILLDERGQRVDVVDKHHVKSRDRSATMNRKMIELELQRVGMRVKTIAFVATAKCACHVWNPATEGQIIRFVDCSIDSVSGYKHIVVGCFIRSDESLWDFLALGLPTKSNSLHALCEYIHNLYPLPTPSSVFPMEPIDVPAKTYLDYPEGLIPAEQLLKAVKVY